MQERYARADDFVSGFEPLKYLEFVSPEATYANVLQAQPTRLLIEYKNGDFLAFGSTASNQADVDRDRGQWNEIRGAAFEVRIEIECY